eukprot:3077633-Pyramimonas_sp.AAC.1
MGEVTQAHPAMNAFSKIAVYATTRSVRDAGMGAPPHHWKYSTESPKNYEACGNCVELGAETHA